MLSSFVAAPSVLGGSRLLGIGDARRAYRQAGGESQQYGLCNRTQFHDRGVSLLVFWIWFQYVDAILLRIYHGPFTRERP